MTSIFSLNDKHFTLNGIQYFRNYISAVHGNKVELYNCYERKDVLVPLTNFSDFTVDGSTFTSAAELQAALLDVTYSRLTTGDSSGIDQNNVGKVISAGNIGPLASGSEMVNAIADALNTKIITITAKDTPVIVTASLLSTSGTSTYIAKRYRYLFKPGKGNWGLNGTSVTASHLELMNIENYLIDDLLREPNAIIENLGDLPDGNFIAAANASQWDFSDSGTEDETGIKTFYFNYTSDNVLYFVQFTGTPGLYGQGETQFTAADFVATTNNEVTETPTLQDVLAQGGNINVSQLTNNGDGTSPYTTVAKLNGLSVSINQAAAELYLKNSEGSTLATVSLGFLNNEGTTFFFNEATEKLELKNDAGVVLSQIPVSAFVSNLMQSVDFNGSTPQKLEFKDATGSVVDYVTLTLNNVAGLNAALALKANLDSPVLAGVPTAPTAPVGTNTTQIATTAFVKAASDAKVSQTITDGVTTSSPSENALYDNFKRYIVTTEIDLNNYRESGQYIVPNTGLINFPSGWAQGRKILYVSGDVNGTYCSQIIHDLVTGLMACRKLYNNIWSGWEEIATNSNVVHTTGTELINGAKTFNTISAFNEGIYNGSSGGIHLLKNAYYNYTNGYFIQTDIPAYSNTMFELYIKGNGYSAGTPTPPIDSIIQGYTYSISNSIVSTTSITKGKRFNVDVFHYGGFVCFWLSTPDAYQTLRFELGTHLNLKKITNVTNAVKPASGVSDSITITPINNWNSQDMAINIANDDWNNINKTGFYLNTSSASPNLPVAESNLSLIHISSGGSQATQIVTSSNNSFRRYRNSSGVWSAWIKLWDNNDFTIADIINWNTAYNRGDFKNYGIGIGASGDGKVFPGTDANDTNVLNGIYSVGTGIVANLPGSNSGTLIVERYTNYITQKFQAINSGDVVKMYIRHYKPASTSWTPWREIWTNENLTPTDLTNWNQAYNNYVSNTYLNPRSSVTFNGDVNELPKGTYMAGMSSLSTNKPFSAVGGLLSVGSTGQLGFQLLGARAGNDLWFRPWATAYENWYKLWNTGDFTSTDISNWNSKQAALISGTNIKTIEGQSLLGSGNIDLSKADVGLSNVDNTSDVNKPVSTATQTALNTKQTTLVSGTNIKTVGGQSLLGSGNLTEVQNNLNASTILAPSVNAVNTALTTKANEADVLHKTGDETKNGNLTVTGNVSGAGATQLNHLVTLGQVNGKINDAFNSRIIFDSTYSGSSSWFSSLNTLYPDASPGLIVYAYSMPGSAGAFAMCVKLPEENVWGICAGSGTVV